MALIHLVDTSVLTRLREAAIRDAIAPRAERAELARAGISDLEIGYSANARDDARTEGQKNEATCLTTHAAGTKHP